MVILSILIVFTNCAFALEDANSTVHDNLIENTNNAVASENTPFDNGPVKADNENQLGTPISPNGNTFNDIQDAIGLANENDTIFLNGDTYIGSGTKITVGKSINIIGGSSLDDESKATLDGNHLSSIFDITAGNVYLKNINFINANSDTNGGAIYWTGQNGNVTDCSFSNNVARSGGAIAWYADYCNITFCNFTNNSVSYSGGAVYFHQGLSGHEIYKCNFVNNSCSYDPWSDGGAIYWVASDGRLSFSNFTGNHAKYSAGAVYWTGSNGSLWNCSFTENYATGSRGGSAGAVFWQSRFGNVTNSTFKFNSAKSSGGALWGDYIDIIVDNCLFINNSANYTGGSIYWSTGGSTFEHAPMIINSIFINSTAKNFGGSINWDAPHANLINLTIINSTSYGYGGGGISISGDISFVSGCNFTNCSSTGSGGALRSTMSFTNITHCNFINTHANGYANYEGPGGGGAIYLYSQGSYISYSTFVNSTTDGVGGAMDLHATGMTIFNCSFENTSAVQDGGAICRKTHDLTVFDNLTFVNSQSKTGSGGAIFWKEPSSYAKSYLGRCNFTNTSAEEYGGAIYWHYGSNVFNINVVNSTAKVGGAIYWRYSGGSLINSNFVNTSSRQHGGALYFYLTSAPLTNLTFLNSSAGTHGGAIYFDYGPLGPLDNANFTNTHAEEKGGAIYSLYNTPTYNVNFINSSAYDGGAIYWDYNWGYIVNATFTNTSATHNGGGVYWNDRYNSHNGNNKFINATFTNSHANADGGSIYWNAYKSILANVSCINSSADQDGGAVFWNTDDGNLTDFHINKAHAERNGGAVCWNAARGIIINSNFTNNTAGNYGGAFFWYGADGAITNDSYFYNNTAIDGGAVYWYGANGIISNSTFDFNKATNTGGAIFWQGINGTVGASLFTNNTALYGGAIYWNGYNGTVIGSDFWGNNATNGSAIYKTELCDLLTIINTQFDKNRANSSRIEIKVSDYESYALADVTVDIYLIGNDNIANAIWNDGTVDTIKLANITCVFSENGIKRPKHLFNELTEPASPYSSYVDDSSLWQSPYEDAQLLDIIITAQRDGETVVMYNITDGVIQSKRNVRGLLSAIRFDDEDINVTDKDGKISIQFTNLKAGTYNIQAEHKWDRYYTDTSNDDRFVVYDLNVTKTTEDVFVGVGQNVTYNITISNNGNQIAKNIKIFDMIPDELELLDYNITWINRTAPDWTLDCSENKKEFTIHNSNQDGDVSFIPPFEKVVITFVFKAIKTGKFNNTVMVTSNVTEINATSQNTTVAPVILNIKKVADAEVIAYNDIVRFTITVSNVGEIDTTDAIVTDKLPDGLTFVNAGIENDPYDVVSYLGKYDNGAKWKISKLNSKETVELWITARANINKTQSLTNHVSVTSRENSTEVNNTTAIKVVPVTPNGNKTENNTKIIINNTEENTKTNNNTEKPPIHEDKENKTQSDTFNEIPHKPLAKYETGNPVLLLMWVLLTFIAMPFKRK